MLASYLNVPFDLSKVVFVATANRMQPIPPPLLDRMEVIELPGYTPEEKQQIAMRHLIPRVLDQHGLSSEFLQIPEVLNFFYIRRSGLMQIFCSFSGSAFILGAILIKAKQTNTSIFQRKGGHLMHY